MYTEILDLKMVIKINKAYFQHRYFYTVRVHRCVKLLIFFSINNFTLVWYCHCWNHDSNLIHTHLFHYFLSWTSKRFGPYKMELWLSLEEILIEPRLNFQRRWTAYLIGFQKWLNHLVPRSLIKFKIAFRWKMQF